MLEINVNIWGRKLWYIIHYLANKFDDKYIDDFQIFFLFKVFNSMSSL